MSEIMTMISTVGFPIVAAVGLGWFCKYMIDKNNENINRMFDMYEKSNSENRQAIEKMTVAVEKLCDKLDKED